MRFPAALLVVLPGLALAAPAQAASTIAAQGRERMMAAAELPAYLECVPYAREATGVRIYGDALTWWDQAEGRYARGTAPRVGAVLALKPSGPLQLGHVAAVSRVIDSRTILVSHANWSPIGGERGQVETNVRAVDVSPRNDWSEVRIWYAPTSDLGTTIWPVQGFIYPGKASAPKLTTPKLAAAPKPAEPPAKEIARAAPRDPIGAIIAGI